MRTIDADALYRKVKAECNPYGKPSIGWEDGQRMMEWIEHAPTVAKDINVPGKWVSMKDRYPETRYTVLVYTPYHKNIWAATMHEDGNWYIWSPGGRVLLDQDWYGPITHWMPLPEPPKEG